jgi:hypothetical protein
MTVPAGASGISTGSNVASLTNNATCGRHNSAVACQSPSRRRRVRRRRHRPPDAISELLGSMDNDHDHTVSRRPGRDAGGQASDREEHLLARRSVRTHTQPGRRPTPVDLYPRRLATAAGVLRPDGRFCGRRVGVAARGHASNGSGGAPTLR